MKNLIIVFLVMVSITVGCGGGDGSDEASANFSEYHPLTKGTFRTYRVTEPLAGTIIRTQAWTSGATYNGQESVRSCESSLSWEDEANVAGQTLSFAFSDETDGLATLDRPYVIGIDNWQPGRTVSTTVTVSLDGFSFPLTIAVTFIGIESVTVPAGTFSDSMKIDISLSNNGNSHCQYQI